MNLEEMRKLAGLRKIKNNRRYSKIELARLLNLDIKEVCQHIPKQTFLKRPAREICITNINTGETHHIKSISKCARFLHKNPGSIQHFLTTGNVLHIDDMSYRLSYV